MEQQVNPDVALGVEFFSDAVEHPRKSKEAGRPIFEDKEFVRIAFPGDNKKIMVAPAHELHYVSAAKRQMTYAERFNASYQAFKSGQADQVVGTPIALAPFLTESLKAELRRQNVKTIEQLAMFDDRIILKFGPGWRERVNAAKDFINQSQAAGENEELRKRIEQLEAMLASKQMNGTQSVPPATPAPAPKAEDPDPKFASKRATKNDWSDFTNEDLFNMATDAGLEPALTMGRDELIEALEKAAAESEAA